MIKKIKENDLQAYDRLFKEHYKPMVIYIRSFSNDLHVAEDIVQNVFMELWIKRNELNIPRSVKGYLYWKAYTSFVDQYRKDKRRRDLLDKFREEAIRAAIPEDHELIGRRAHRLNELIGSLPPTCKTVFELNKKNGLRYHEIAERLNISKKTVESHMNTAFKKIREGFKNGFILFMIGKIVFKPGQRAVAP